MSEDRRPCASSSSSFAIGNCTVEVEGDGVLCDASHKSLVISLLSGAKVKISVNHTKQRWSRKSRKEFLSRILSEGSDEERNFSFNNYSFLLVNPKDIDSRNKCLQQNVIELYKGELPSMRYAANTGKESLFLERCVSSGKYCTLLLRTNANDGCGEVIAAISYQIVPTDTQYAEIPLAVVGLNYQRKGIGHFLYMELKKRLQEVGVATIICWGDKESEGFWLKQGFTALADVDAKGRARKLPIKADIRRALCFPGGSILMVSHLIKSSDTSNLAKLCSTQMFAVRSCPTAPLEASEILGKIKNGSANLDMTEQDVLVSTADQIESRQLHASTNTRLSMKEQIENDSSKGANNKSVSEFGITERRPDINGKSCSCSGPSEKRKVWEASWSSLKSKKIKGGHHIHCKQDAYWDLCNERDTSHDIDLGDSLSLAVSKDKSLVNISPGNYHEPTSLDIHPEENNVLTGVTGRRKSPSGEHPAIMLMNIADDNKKLQLSKIIEELGGSIASHGSSSTHIITGKARRTLNFCTALSSGAWIISPSWLKNSFREGRFLDESLYILKDEEYEQKYKCALEDAVLRAKERPNALLKGYNICFAKHVQPPADILTAIVNSAGGNVIKGLEPGVDPSRVVFVACEEDMVEALEAARRGTRTYGSEWLVNCVMKQELDFDAQQFAESL